MKKTEKLDKVLTQEYVPIAEFMKVLTESNPLPYESRFSFKPFLDKYMCTIGGVCSHTASEMSPKIEYLEKMIADGWLSEEAEEFNVRLNSTMALLMPSMLFNNEPVFIAPPFVKKFVYSTPAQKELMSSGKWDIRLNSLHLSEGESDNIQQAGGLILKQFYNQKADLFLSQVIILRNVDSGLERHFKMTLNFDFVEIELKKPLKKLSEDQISALYRNVHDEALWLKYLPVENFAFSGFGIGKLFDVTEIEVLSILKDELVLEGDAMQADVFLPKVSKQIKNFIGCPKINVGFVGVEYAEQMGNHSFSKSGTNDLDLLSGIHDHENGYGIYQQVQDELTAVVKEDLSVGQLSIGEEMLLNNGYKSVILFPAIGHQGNISGIFEIVSPFSRAFNQLSISNLKNVFELLQLGSDKYFRELDNRRASFIQKQFTSIHPSVEWKFDEVAKNYEIRNTLPDFDGTMEPIVFENVYPLYGQADIVSSSTKRNASIQADLLANLKGVLHVMTEWAKIINLHLLDAYIVRVDKLRVRLKKEFVSSDESSIVDLLKFEIHPLLVQLKEEYDQVPEKPYQDYLASLDSHLGILYNERKKYEQSVSTLNSAISDYVETDNEKMQITLPHYFEKYKTDGVEYNLYIGQALLNNQKFNDYHLKEFRLWQLVQMCEITRLVDDLSQELPVPLLTAQLVFVYNNSLSIRFRMDEKQFDVDGAYNVRYEILKKRIDKAYIKGTDERLTQAGKISIVYLQEKDKAEYKEYINFLIDSGLIKKDYEELELEKLQGADGLKAIRLEVIIPAKKISATTGARTQTSRKEAVTA